MKNETDFIALVARMMGETKRMQFTVTGPKALPDEMELTIHDLMTYRRSALRSIQRYRVTHAVAWEQFDTKAVIEIWGVFPN